MKKLLALLALLSAPVAYAATINSAGTSTAPVAVAGTAVKVLAGKVGRKAYCIYPETVAIRCNVGTPQDGAPAVTPTTTRGFLFPAAQLICVNPGSNANYSGAIDPQQRLDCISTTGVSTSVDSFETP